jgi:hypothetical protein
MATTQLPKVVLGVKFADGIEVIRSQAQVAAAKARNPAIVSACLVSGLISEGGQASEKAPPKRTRGFKRRE